MLKGTIKMKEELEDKIIEKYPELFKEEETGMTVVCGIECNDGWYDLLDKLCTDITKSCKENQYPFPTVVQVKEKFGGLRFYVNDAVDQIYTLIEKAEQESYKICEQCGTREDVEMRKRNTWLTTLCDNCYQVKGHN